MATCVFCGVPGAKGHITYSHGVPCLCDTCWQAYCEVLPDLSSRDRQKFDNALLEHLMLHGCVLRDCGDDCQALYATLLKSSN